MNQQVQKAFKGMLLGPFLGEGLSREVYECRTNPSWVVKVAKEDSGPYPSPTQNCIEYEVWESYENDKVVSKYLAPCEMISNCGLVLVQDRTKTVSEKEFKAFLKKNKIPAFLTDLKIENWGWLGDRIVAHDYGFISMEANLKKRSVY